MDLIKMQIPWSFIRARCKLAWREILFGLDNELLAPDAPREVAIDEMGEDPSPACMALAISEPSDPMRSRVQQLAEAEPAQPDDEIRDKWLYLVLAWTLENAGLLDKPLDVVHEVYADFGYPEDMRAFDPYASTDEAFISREHTEKLLFERWKAFVAERAARYALPAAPEQSADDITPPASPRRGTA